MRIAVYAGSFDPMTLGHLSVAKAAAAAFDEVVVLVADNPEKNSLFDAKERVRLARATVADIPNIRCDATDGYVVEYARNCGAKFLVRGVRDATDANYETRLSNINRAPVPEITTFFIPADPELAKVSSSGLRAMARNGDDGSRFCTADVWRQLVAKTNAQVAREQEMAL